MIQEKQVVGLVENRIEDTGLFLVDVTIGSSGDIRVLVDSMEGVKIEECVELSRWLTGELDQTDENYSLEVSSPGIGAPLKLMQQYVKNIGREVEVILKTGEKKKGELKAAGENIITLEMNEKMLSGGSQKKKKHVKVEKMFELKDIKSTKVVIKF